MTVTHVVPVEAPPSAQVRAGLRDLREGMAMRGVWWMLAVRSVRHQYKRTILGPWWLSLQMLMFVLGLALLRVSFTDRDIAEAVPYVGLGYLAFSLISAGLVEGSRVYVSAGTQLSVSTRPYSTYVYRSSAVTVIQFLHDCVILLPFALLGWLALGWGSLWSLAAAALLLVTGVGVGLWMGPLALRFRDVGPLVGAFMRLAFFLTPIFWSIDQVTGVGRTVLVTFNPFAYQVLAFRDPLVGADHGWTPMVVTGLLALVNSIAGLLVFTLTRTRLAYWA